MNFGKLLTNLFAYLSCRKNRFHYLKFLLKNRNERFAMKQTEPKSSKWCKIQEILLDSKCPDCFSKELKECECDSDKAECARCGCTFKIDLEAARNNHRE